jgi:hypothetical protein
MYLTTCKNGDYYIFNFEDKFTYSLINNCMGCQQAWRKTQTNNVVPKEKKKGPFEMPCTVILLPREKEKWVERSKFNHPWYVLSFKPSSKYR